MGQECRTVGPAVGRVLAANRNYVEATRDAVRPASGRPALGLAVISCMDARLTRLLPDALGLEDGDAAIVQAAGATIVEPYGEAMRSLLVAIGELGVREVLVVGHTDCGTCGMRAEHLLGALARAGSDARALAEAEADRELMGRLAGFEHLEGEVADSVRAIREHPLVPRSVRVTGCTIDVVTGELTLVEA